MYWLASAVIIPHDSPVCGQMSGPTGGEGHEQKHFWDNQEEMAVKGVVGSDLPNQLQ